MFGQCCFDLRSFFRAADRSSKGALDRNEVQQALQRLDLGLSSGQLCSLIGTLWNAPPMSRSEIHSASMHTTGGQSGHKVRGQTPSRAILSSTGHGDDGETFLISTASPLTGSVSPAVLSSLLLDSVTEDEFVSWADPCRVKKALFVLRRRRGNQPGR